MSKKLSERAAVIRTLRVLKNAETDWPEGYADPYVREILAKAEQEQHENLFRLVEAAEAGSIANRGSKSGSGPVGRKPQPGSPQIRAESE